MGTKKTLTDSEIKIESVDWEELGVYNLQFYTANGGSLILSIEETISIELKNCSMDEAATAFFYKIIKPIADGYIKAKLSEKKE